MPRGAVSKGLPIKDIVALNINIIFILKYSMLIFRTKSKYIKGSANYNKYQIKLMISDMYSTGFIQ